MAAASSSVVVVEGDEEFEALVAANRSVLVDFSAAWCRPCKAIAPLWRRLAAEHAGTVFATVDVDVCEETAQKCGVNSMPTFQHFERGSKVAELVGLSPPPPGSRPVGLSRVAL